MGSIADRVGVPRGRVTLGGDHPGPNPWKHLPPADAMARAEAMVAAYAAAGFEKLHLDCSMGCAGEPASPGTPWPSSPAPPAASAAPSRVALPPKGRAS